MTSSKPAMGSAVKSTRDLPTERRWTDEEGRKEKGRILKNIILISISFLLIFNAFQGLSRLQSSLHRTQGMGTVNQSVLYVALVFSCLFLPKLMIAKLGHKWVIPVSFVGYILWMAANGYAVWGTMIPASIIVGLSAAPLWTAQCSYFSLVGTRYAKIAKETEEAIVTRFFGIFFCFFQMSGITGSVISATVLRPTPVNGSEKVKPTEEQLQFCGARECPWEQTNTTNPNTLAPAHHTVVLMLGIYIAIGLLGVAIVCLFVDRLPRDLEEEHQDIKKEIGSMLLNTMKHLRHVPQLLLIPLTMYSGFEQAFFNAEWSRSFVTCTVGIWTVGLVTLPFGVVNATVSFVSGVVVKYTGRIPVFVAGMVTDLAIQFTMMFYMPHPSQTYVLYIISGLWGFTDAIWQTQINALYGCVFSDAEAAFANYRMWESLGFIVAFAYSSSLCTNVKIYILTSVLLVGMVGYFMTEYYTWKTRDTQYELNTRRDRELPKDVLKDTPNLYIVHPDTTNGTLHTPDRVTTNF